MVREALTNYLSLASGLTDVTRQRARAAARALVSQGEATVEQVTGLAEEIVQTSRANRSALLHLIRYEIERALGRLGLATADQTGSLQRRISELERTVRELRATREPAAGAKRAATRAPRAPAKAAKTAKATKKTTKATKATRTASRTTSTNGARPAKKSATSGSDRAGAP
jgi:polyhydroxyalkanoate synthesis regulator phasin